MHAELSYSCLHPLTPHPSFYPLGLFLNRVSSRKDLRETHAVTDLGLKGILEDIVSPLRFQDDHTRRERALSKVTQGV